MNLNAVDCVQNRTVAVTAQSDYFSRTWQSFRLSSKTLRNFKQLLNGEDFQVGFSFELCN